MADNYGLKYTVARLPFKVDADSADINVGDMLTYTDASSGYVKKVDAKAEAVMGVAEQAVTSPDNDGDKTVMVLLSKEYLFEYPADEGTVTQALVGTSLDVGADGRSIDIDGTTTADLYVAQVNVDDNTCLVQRA